MKRAGVILGSALFLAGFVACSRRPADVPAAAQPDPAIAERQALFGADALARDIQWRDNGLGVHVIAAGTPPQPGIGDPVKLTYVGRLKDGTVFDRSDKPVEFRIGGTIPGLSAGLQLLGTGGKAVFFIPPSLGYGPRKVAGIPPHSGLIFEVTVVAVNP